MNIVDIIILLVVGISVIYGFYHGFIQTVANLAAALLSIGAAFLFGPRVAGLFMANTGLTGLLSTYTDAVVRVGDYDLASSQVASITQSTIDTILRSVKLPQPLADVLQQNLSTRAFQSTGVTTVNGYVSGTIIAAAVQVLSYLLVFVAAYLVLTFLISLIRHVADFPILKQLDWLAGGAFGLARGVVFVYLLLLLVPLVSTIVPTEGVAQLIAQSSLAHLFSGDGFFVRVISQ
ncbi:MAG: CvpA family protein [Clostridiales bacterium]|nr:CvpA family protein [Clostridiales bacterium]